MSLIKVRALHRGQYAGLLRREGDVFTLTRGEDYNPRWMVRAWDQEPEHTSSAQDAIDRLHDLCGALGPVRAVETVRETTNRQCRLTSTF